MKKIWAFIDQFFLITKGKMNPGILNQMYYETTKRGDILALTVIIVELLLAIRSLSLFGYPADMTVLERNYFYTYCLLICLMVAIWLSSKYFNKHTVPYPIKRIATLIACEAVVLPLIYISFLDQHGYGQVSVYFCALVCVAIYPILEPMFSLILLLINQTIFSIGIFNYQSDVAIATGHIINTIPFVVFMWFISRRFFVNKFHEYKDAEIIKIQNEELIQLYNESSLKDDLTGIGNRRYLRQNFSTLRTNCLKEQHLMTMMFIDGDNLKKVNDTLGHNFGDIFIKNIADALKWYTKNGEGIIGRLGGDEFLVISDTLTETTADTLATNIKDMVKATTKFNERNEGTISIGIVQLTPDKIKDFSHVMAAADQSLYEAKRQGRDAIVTLNF